METAGTGPPLAISRVDRRRGFRAHSAQYLGDGRAVVLWRSDRHHSPPGGGPKQSAYVFGAYERREGALSSWRSAGDFRPRGVPSMASTNDMLDAHLWAYVGHDCLLLLAELSGRTHGLHRPRLFRLSRPRDDDAGEHSGATRDVPEAPQCALIFDDDPDADALLWPDAETYVFRALLLDTNRFAIVRDDHTLTLFRYDALRETFRAYAHQALPFHPAESLGMPSIIRYASGEVGMAALADRREVTRRLSFVYEPSVGDDWWAAPHGDVPVPPHLRAEIESNAVLLFRFDSVCSKGWKDRGTIRRVALTAPHLSPKVDTIPLGPGRKVCSADGALRVVTYGRGGGAVSRRTDSLWGVPQRCKKREPGSSFSIYVASDAGVFFRGPPEDPERLYFCETFVRESLAIMALTACAYHVRQGCLDRDVIHATLPHSLKPTWQIALETLACEVERWPKKTGRGPFTAWRE